MEEPRQLVPQVLEHLNPSEDIEAQNDIQSFLVMSDTRRAQTRDAAFQQLLQVERKTEVLKEVYQNKLIERESSSALHSAKMMELSKSKFSAASLVDDLKRTSNALQKELDFLTSQMEQISAEEKKESEIPPDEISLKLQISRSLGIDLIKQNSDYSKARVISNKNNDIITVEFNEQFSKYYYANILWEMCH